MNFGVYTSPSNGFPDIPPGPCEGCEHRAKCADELLVCTSFADFVRHSRVAASTLARRDLYRSIFSTS